MSDRSIVPSSSRIASLIRDAMRGSPVHRIECRIPEHLGDLLDRLDEAEARHAAQVAAFRTSYQ